ncbi:acyltransferase family protein [Jiella mangrovi]|uniref:Acyltransferase n=1 Tax=Jiella mangrovi TaxID=2821407 RepID=A0ABS4BID2_9HYPH|nr:acyltransferase [Jiella mangrovi]MBP0616527.1 acyltransferase [Jiella mangrovi]
MIEGRAAVKNDGARFQALDGWRGVCALLVVCFHAPVTGFAETSGLIRHAFLFVDFFFVLSGFVITHAFFEKLRESRDFGRFFLFRLFRVYPLHLFMLVLYVGFELALLLTRGPGSAFEGGTSVPALVYNLLMVQSLGFLDTLSWNYPSWSISAEVVAYACFGLVMVTVPRLIVPLAGLAVIVGLPIIAVVHGGIDVSSNLGWLRCVAGFAVGVILRRVVWRDEARRQSQSHALSWSLAELAAMVLVVVFVVLVGGTVLSVAAPLVFGLALYVFAHEGGIVSQGLKSRPFAFLGLISYSIYMTHAFVIDRFHNVVSAIGRMTGQELFFTAAYQRELIATPGWLGSLILLAIIVATLLFSAITWRFVEQPGMALGRRLLARSNQGAGSSGTPQAA